MVVCGGGGGGLYLFQEDPCYGGEVACDAVRCVFGQDIGLPTDESVHERHDGWKWEWCLAGVGVEWSGKGVGVER